MNVESRVDTLLRVIADCHEDGVPADESQLRARLRDPAVAATARTAADAELVTATPGGWALTPAGRERATSAVRRHRTIEAFLAQVVGVDWADVHAEACRWEQVAGDIVVAKMARQLRDRANSPYGGAIPPSAERTPPTPTKHAVPLVEAIGPDPRAVRVVRVGEVLQDEPDQLPRLASAGCFPGIEVLASTDRGGAVVEAPGGVVHLADEYAAALFVEPIG